MKKPRLFLLAGLLTIIGGGIQTAQAAEAGAETLAALQQQQGIKVKGTVEDAMGPIIGASVIEKGTGNGVVTDFDGNFALTVKPGAQLEISYIGYKTEVVEVGNKTQFSVTLKEDNEVLEEVVVVGYGVQKKKLVTGATVQVKGDDVAKMNTTSALGALQSQTPGVNITASNGQPGEGFKVNIRGLGTVGNSEPLYVIDGVAGGDINSLNPADIESIDVLKDAASAAIYGSRAANGVILVTTKQGKIGKMQVSYDGYVGWSNVYKMPNTLTAQQAIALENERLFNNNAPAYNWQAQLGTYTWQKLQQGWTGTNWVDEMRNKNAVSTNHAINLAGGSDISKFSAGFSYTSQDGIIGKPVTPNYTRYTARLNSDHVLWKGKKFDILKVGENLTFYYSTRNTIAQMMNDYNDIRSAILTTPLLPLHNADGELFGLADKQQTGWAYKDDQGNPVMIMKNAHGQNKTRTYGLSATAYLEFQPIEGLKYRSQYSYRQTNYTYRSLTSPYAASSTYQSNAFQVHQESSNGHDIAIENTISYVFPDYKNHHFDVLVGQSYETTGPGETLAVDNSATNGQQLPTMKPDMNHAYISNTANALNGTDISGAPFDEWAIASFFGRVNYSWQEKYMATFIIRADGSSNFARGHRWGYFPSASAGWTITEEKFMEKTRSWLDFLKVRFSWGKNGNQSIQNFQYVSPVAFDLSHAYAFGPTLLPSSGTKSVGAYVQTLANEDVSWEKSEQFDLGIDAVMLSNRLRLNADWYVKYTKDWLVQAPILATAGAGAPYINGGDVRNSGFEVGLSWNDRIGKEFSYGVNLNFSYNKNKVTRIANTEKIIHGDTGVFTLGTSEFYRAEEGFPIGYFWGYETAGVFQNQQQINDWIAAGNGVAQANPQPGDLIYVDRDHDGAINIQDKTMIGNPHPDCRFGFSANASYKGFDLSLTATAATGQQIVYSFNKNNNTTAAFDRWHGEGTSNRQPALRDGSSLASDISDIDIEDGDYLRMQNITLGYDFKKLFPQMPIQQARLYVTAQNLFTITGYKGMDPEIGFGGNDVKGNTNSWVTGIDTGSYPAARTFLVGINLKF